MNEPTNAAGRVSALLSAPRIVGLIAPALLLSLFALPTLMSLHEVWTTSYYYSHGYVVLALTAMLVVQELKRAPLAPAFPSWAGFICLALLVLVTMAARAMTVETVEQFALPLYCIAAGWALIGWVNARRFVLPLGYLWAAIPVWGVFIEPLRRLTVRVVSAWIHIAGMPAFIEGNLIHVPSGTFEVMEGCSGLRYALVTLALTSLMGLTSYRRWAPTAVLTFFALVLVSVANWVRVFVTVAVGFAPGTAVATLVRDNHNIFGWMMFVVFMFPIVYVHRMLEAGATRVSRTDGGDVSHRASARRPTAVIYASCAVLALAAYITLPVTWAHPESNGTGVFEPPEVAGWTRVGGWQDSRAPAFTEASVQGGAWYTHGAARVGAYVAGYASQQQGREVGSPRNIPTGRFGVAAARRNVTVKSVSGSSIPFQELDVSEPGDERRLVWIGLRVAGLLAGSGVAAKVLQLRGAIHGRRDAQAVVLTASCESDCAEARDHLSRFAATAAELLYAQAEHSARAQQRLSTVEDLAER
jgi:EpsI family protein